MNIYEVVFKTKRHYGNGYIQYEEDTPMRIMAEDGEQAVKKARKKISFAEPILESLTKVMNNVD